MAFTFLVAKGIDVGKSIVEPDWVEPAKEMLVKAEAKGVDIVLPVDFVVADAFAEDAETRIAGREEIPADMMGLDIGPASDELFKGAIADAKTIFWNGPMGVFEMTPFETGTRGGRRGRRAQQPRGLGRRRRRLGRRAQEVRPRGPRDVRLDRRRREHEAARRRAAPGLEALLDR